MAAQQQQRVAQANALSANINSLQRNNTAVMAAAMKRGRQQNVSKPQSNANALRNNSFKNFNSSLLSNNYQLAAATLAAANTQFLQQVVVSFCERFCRCSNPLTNFLPFSGSETCDVEPRGCSCCREFLPSNSRQLRIIKVLKVERVNAKHLHHAFASTTAARNQAGSEPKCGRRKAAICYLRDLRRLH
jgi:hypothetical protein